ncbi:hypothetical protein B0H10DRAFT_1954348 [Mycena sp. CBHHK59/15]|nr:hypothetical protein B0H10DRAFT_1954348 [Mycena sp. CBHHK59/15]
MPATLHDPPGCATEMKTPYTSNQCYVMLLCELEHLKDLHPGLRITGCGSAKFQSMNPKKQTNVEEGMHQLRKHTQAAAPPLEIVLLTGSKVRSRSTLPKSVPKAERNGKIWRVLNKVKGMDTAQRKVIDLHSRMDILFGSTAVIQMANDPIRRGSSGILLLSIQTHTPTSPTTPTPASPTSSNEAGEALSDAEELLRPRGSEACATAVRAWRTRRIPRTKMSHLRQRERVTSAWGQAKRQKMVTEFARLKVPQIRKDSWVRSDGAGEDGMLADIEVQPLVG